MTPLEIEALIRETASRTPGVGPLEESLKWGEQSFAPRKSGIGSSVRIQPRSNGDMALMFICHTNLVDEFRAIYRDTLVFEGNRAIVLQAGHPLEKEALSHCIGMALTYKLRKHAGKTRKMTGEA